MAKKKTPHPFSSDQPIARLKDDRLGRDKFAEGIAKAMMAWSGEDSLVIAIYGDWGDGKSSVKGMILDALRKHKKTGPIITEFNPWEWAGQNQIAGAFFEEIGKQIGQQGSAEAKKTEKRVRLLGKCLTTVGSLVEKSGNLINLAAPGAKIVTDAFAHGAKSAGDFSTHVAGALADQLELDTKTLSRIKKDLQNGLLKLNRRVVVFIDDVDRLTADEIKLLFQLVKANADFPNLIFCLLFQRETIEKSLEETIRSGTGREYLEKIVQVGFDLPKIPRPVLDQFVHNRLRQVLEKLDVHHDFNWSEWKNNYLDYFCHYFRNLRDIHRFFGTFEFHLGVFKGKTLEINPVDLFSLEVIRIFEPAAYRIIAHSKTIFFGDARQFSVEEYTLTDQQRTTRGRGAVLTRMPEQVSLRMTKTLESIFPNPQDGSQPKWQRELRVCHESFFDRYFQLCIPQGDLAQSELNETLSLLGNRKKFAGKLLELDDRFLSRLVLIRLLAYGESFESRNAGAVAGALFDIGDKIIRQFNSGGQLPELSTVSYSLINAHLKEIYDPNQRFLEIKGAIESSPGIFLSAIQARHESYRVGVKAENGVVVGGGCLLTGQQTEELQLICAARIEKAAFEGSIHSHPELHFLLRFWMRWGDQQRVRMFVSELANKSALSVLEIFFKRALSDDDIEHYLDVFFSDNLGELNQYLDVTEFKMKLDKLQPETLTPNQQRALRVFDLLYLRHKGGT